MPRNIDNAIYNEVQMKYINIKWALLFLRYYEVITINSNYDSGMKSIGVTHKVGLLHTHTHTHTHPEEHVQ
jgi:hypothetical protein